MDESFSRSSSVAEEEVFEITDFTTVSDWERFIAQITDAVTEWQLTCVDSYKPLQKHELTSGKWEQLSREIRFSNAIFILTLYRLKQSNEDDQYFDETESTSDDDLHFPACMQDMMSVDNDFPPRAHCLVRWYGFRSFVTLSLITTGTSGGSGLTSESKCNLLLSSACIVLSESGCEVPLFIQVQQNWRKMFTGRCVGNGMQTEFEMVHLKKCPPQYRHLSGLLHVFKSKIGRTITPVLVSARFTYVLSNWGSRGTWPQETVDPDVAAQTLHTLLFGCLDDPVSDLQLSAVWPSVYENVIIENDVNSDFNPLIAPVWTVKISYTDNPECLLSSYLRDMIKLTTSVETFGSLIKTTAKEDEQDISQALSKLTDSSHKVKKIVPLMPELSMGISKIVSTPTSVWARRMKSSSHATTGPISQAMLELVMAFLFPEENLNVTDTIDDKVQENKGFSQKLEYQLKSAPKESLTYRLATCLSVMNYCHGGITAIAQVWHEFIQEMRYRFENGVSIAGITSENPDLRCCLLHQKLQMLNCCILHKNAREKKQSHFREVDFDQSNAHSDKPVCSKDEADILRSNDSDDPKQQIDSACTHQVNEDSIEQVQTSPVDDSCSSLPTVEAVDSPEPPISDISAERKDSSTSQKSNGWQDEVSSVEDEFFDCDDGDVTNDVVNAASDVTEVIYREGNMEKEDLPGSQEVRNSEDGADSVITSDANDTNLDTGVKSENDKSQMDCSNHDVIISNVDVPTDHTVKPEGRLEAFEDATLMKFNTQIFVPITQEPAPMTEDTLEEQTKIFSSLGDSAEGAILRRKMQSASLLSDMESFKAANPGCILLDFVRWYSRRDYEVVNGCGQLSERMKLPGNLWQTMWDTAKPVPARRQKRLFDDTKEGEKVLHFLSSLLPKDLILQLMPICFHEAISILERESTQDLPSLPRLCSQILSQSGKLFRGNFAENSGQMEDILQKLQFTETLIARVMSLKHKFQNVSDSFVRNVIENPEVTLENAASGELGNVIKQYFLDQATAIAKSRYSPESEPSVKIPSFPAPIGKEYILRTTAPNPSSQSRILPHRMYAVLMKGEFRLAGAFSTDTVFF